MKIMRWYQKSKNTWNCLSILSVCVFPCDLTFETLTATTLDNNIIDHFLWYSVILFDNCFNLGTLSKRFWFDVLMRCFTKKENVYMQFRHVICHWGRNRLRQKYVDTRLKLEERLNIIKTYNSFSLLSLLLLSLDKILEASIFFFIITIYLKISNLPKVDENESSCFCQIPLLLLLRDISVYFVLFL